MSQSDTYFSKLAAAQNSRAFAGDFCIVIGWSTIVLGLVLTFGFFTVVDRGWWNGLFALISFAIALAGGPIAAVGVQTNAIRKQTEIAILQAQYIEFIGHELD